VSKSIKNQKVATIGGLNKLCYPMTIFSYTSVTLPPC